MPTSGGTATACSFSRRTDVNAYTGRERAELYYEEYGSGPDVVISAQNRISSGPESYLELLAAAGAHVYSIQLRSFGRSSPVATIQPQDGWYPTWAAGRVCVCTESRGGAIHLHGRLARRRRRLESRAHASARRCAPLLPSSVGRTIHRNREYAAWNWLRPPCSSCRPATHSGSADALPGCRRAASTRTRRATFRSIRERSFPSSKPTNRLPNALARSACPRCCSTGPRTTSFRRTWRCWSAGAFLAQNSCFIKITVTRWRVKRQSAWWMKSRYC